jgi:hypothetical protein
MRRVFFFNRILADEQKKWHLVGDSNHFIPSGGEGRAKLIWI